MGIPRASRFDYRRILQNNKKHLRHTCRILHEDVNFAESLCFLYSKKYSHFRTSCTTDVLKYNFHKLRAYRIKHLGPPWTSLSMVRCMSNITICCLYCNLLSHCSYNSVYKAIHLKELGSMILLGPFPLIL